MSDSESCLPSHSLSVGATLPGQQMQPQSSPRPGTGTVEVAGPAVGGMHTAVGGMHICVCVGPNIY